MRRLAVIAIVLAACGGSSSRVVVGAGTTLVDSGFIDAVVSTYEAQTGGEVSVIAESSQRLLDLAGRGEIDLTLTHDPEALAAFVSAGNSIASTPVLVSRFLLVGPPSRVRGLTSTDAVEIFRTIADEGLPFVSRDDGSGTFQAESAAWTAAGRQPSGQPWYVTTGQGMGLSLQVASQRGAFIVVEEGAWLAAHDSLRLAEVSLDGDWPNTYAATVIRGGSEQAARSFYDWLLSGPGAQAITAANEALFGTVVYRHVPD